MRHYSLGQFKAFLTLGWARSNDALLSLAIATRSAYHADGDGFKAFAESLTEE